MDPIFCVAMVDFDVPGKPNPPSTKLMATVWTLSHFLPKGTEEKNAIEFTDPSGKLASPSVPLNTWVQIGRQTPTSAPKKITSAPKTGDAHLCYVCTYVYVCAYACMCYECTFVFVCMYVCTGALGVFIRATYLDVNM